MRVLLKAPFNRLSGYGNDGVDIARWMDRLGVDVRLYPMNVVPPLPEDFVHLLTKPVEKSGYDIALQFAPPFEISVREHVSSSWSKMGMNRQVAEKHVGWSMWETDRLTPADMRGHSLGQHPWRLLDRMYVTWPGCIDTFRSYDQRPEYRVMPCGIDGALYPVVTRSTHGTTKFCIVGELHQRKDPFVAIQAFQELVKEKGESFDAELHLKTSIGGLHPKIEEWNPRIKVHSGIWPYPQLISWMHEMTCYVGPSRGEGNLKPPMEFMATGGPVIVTNWSGPTNWLHRDVSYPLEYELMPMNGADSPRQARASKEHLKELMWHVHTHRTEASRKGRRAADWIREVAGWDVLMAKMIRELEAFGASRLVDAP